MKIRSLNNLDDRSIFWLAQLICLVAHIGYCSDLVAKPIQLSSFQVEIVGEHTLQLINTFIPLYAALNAMISVCIFIFLENLLARILFFFLTTSVIYLLFINHPGHNMHLLVWTVFYGLLLPRDSFSNPKNSMALKKYVRIMQIQILLVYSIAGVWKAFYFLKSFADPNLASGKDYLSYAIAHEFINSGHVSIFSAPLMDRPWLIDLFSLAALALQILSIGAIPFPRYYRFWGVLIALFHLGTLVTLNVFFIWPIFLSLVFLAIPSTEEVKW